MDSERRRVVIVEDDRFQVTLLERVLAAEGFETTSCLDGLEAVRVIEEVRPGLILLDIMMPFLDGFEVVQRLKANEKTAGIPIVVISARRDMDSILQMRKLGVKDYLTKPCDKGKLIETVRAALK